MYVCVCVCSQVVKMGVKFSIGDKLSPHQLKKLGERLVNKFGLSLGESLRREHVFLTYVHLLYIR